MAEPKIPLRRRRRRLRAKMGVWSRRSRAIYSSIGWHIARALRWIDIGCGNGAFTELLVDRCAPASRSRASTRRGATRLCAGKCAPVAWRSSSGERRREGASLPADSFDAAVMALVIFFVPDPAKASPRWHRSARRTRAALVTRPMHWTCWAAAFLREQIRAEMRAMGLKPRPRRAPTRRGSKLCATYGQGRALRRFSRERSRVQRTFTPISIILVDQHPGGRVLAPSARRHGVRRCRAAQNGELPGGACRRTPQGASPTVRASARIEPRAKIIMRRAAGVMTRRRPRPLRGTSSADAA